MRQILTVLVGVACAVGAYAQTPPQKPNTTPIPTTPDLVLPGPPTANEASTKPLTADEAALIALRLQPSVTVAMAQAAAAAASVREAFAGLLPSVSVNSEYSWFTNLGHNNSNTGTTGTSGTVTGNTSINSSISAHQLIFDFERTMDSVREARANAKAADYNFTAVQANLVFQVKQQFYTVAQDLQLVGVYEAEVKSTQDQLNLTVGQLSVGLGVPSDVVTATANVANATSSLVQARETYLIARVQLAALIGVDPRTPLTLADSSEPANNSLDFNALVDSGLRNRPEVHQAEETLRAAGYEVSIARKELLPSIDLTATVGSTGVNNPFATNTGSLGISLNWTLFDGGLSAGQVAAARASALQAKANLVSTTQTIVSDVSSAFVSLQSAQQRVEVAGSAVANAQEGLRLSQGRFKAGVTTFVEVTQAQTTLVTAQSDQVTAVASLQTARAQLSKAIGTPIKAPRPDDLKPIVPSTGQK